MEELSRRSVLVGGVSLVAGAALVGCGSDPNTQQDSLALAEHHPQNYPPDVLPLNVPPSSSNKGLSLSEEPNPYIDEIGRGYDSTFDETRMFFVDGDVVRSSHNSIGGATGDSLNFELTETQESYYAFTKKSARAKARWKIFSGEGRARKTSEKTSNSYTLHICALARRFDDSHNLRNGSLKLTKEGEALYQRFKDRPAELLKLLGDSYISGIVPGAELLIDIQYETSSRSSKGRASADLAAAVKGFGSASGSYGQLINATSAAKRVKVNLVGLDGLDLPQEYTAERATALIEQFLKNKDVATKSFYTNYRPIHELTLKGRPLDFVNYEDLSRRERFIAEAESLIELLDRVEADAEYVRDNPAEFNDETKKRADADLILARQSRSLVFDIGEPAYAKYRQTGYFNFDYKAFAGVLPQFSTYEQVEPAAPTPPPPKPRPKPETRTRCNGSCRDGPIGR